MNERPSRARTRSDGRDAGVVARKRRTTRRIFCGLLLLVRPKDRKKYPSALFVHGRRGLDKLVLVHAARLAARGFVVYAPDLYTGRFIPKYPIEHDYALEDDFDAGLDAFLKLPDIRGRKVCVYLHTRGGYYALKLAVTKGRQQDALACYVSYYPHLQDPSAPEPLQGYSYAPEIDDLTLLVLIFVGEHEQYQRKRIIDSLVVALRSRNQPVTTWSIRASGATSTFARPTCAVSPTTWPPRKRFSVPRIS